MLKKGGEFMKYIISKKIQKPFLHTKNNIIIEVNNEFIKFIGYSRDKFIGRSLAEISYMLRIKSEINLSITENDFLCYVFTESCEPREVIICCKDLDYENEKIYFFKEKPNSRIEDKSMFIKQLYGDKKIGFSIRSVPDLILLNANEEYLKFYDIPYSNIGKKQKEIVVGFEKSKEEEIFLEVIKTGKSYYSEESNTENFERGTIDDKYSVVPIFVEGEIKYIIDTIEEVKEVALHRNFIENNKEQQLDAIIENKEQLETIIDGMSDALLIFNKYGNYTTFNKAARQAFPIEFIKLNNIGDGLKEAEYFDRDKKRISYDNTPAHRVARGEKLLGYRMSIKTKDSVVYHDINGTPIYDNEGKFVAGILCSRDITEKMKYEEGLLIRTQYDFLNRMIDNLDLPVLRLSYPDTKVIDVNQKGYNIFRKLNPKIKSISYLIGQNYEDITNFDKKEVLKHIGHVIKNKEASYLKCQRLVLSGEEMFMNLLYQPVFGVDGEVSEIVGILIDVTQEVMTNNQMERILKTHEKFFVNISHELKTPLNVIFSTVQLFNSYLKDECLINNKDKVTNYTDIMMKNCYRLSKLINNLVDLSKIESGFFKLNLSNENIVEVIEDIVQLVSQYVKSKGFNIIFDTNIEEKIIMCDTNKISRVILNLISNAIKFSKPGDEIHVNVTCNIDTVEISVKDNGMGIDEKNLESIFERFKQVDKSFTRNAEGSGIGLCLVKSIVELHGGKITAESKLGKGSNFKIDLPVRFVQEMESANKREKLNGNFDMINMEFSDIYY